MEVKRLRNDELYHHGIKGQRWGIRRYQNPDGSLTAEGKARARADYSDMYYKDASGKRKLSNDKAFKNTQDKQAKELHSNKHVIRYNNDVKSYYNPNTGNYIQIRNKRYEERAIKEAKKIFQKYADEYVNSAVRVHNLDNDPITRSIVRDVITEDYYKYLL